MSIATERMRTQDRLRRNVIVRTLYNPGEEKVEFLHAGVPYVIPPDGPSKERILERPGISSPGIVEDLGDHVVYDGTLKVQDRYGVDPKLARAYQKLKRAGRPAQEPIADKLLAGAMDIVEHALNKRGDAGVIFLTGRPEEDGPEIEKAKERAIQHKLAMVERVLKNYNARTDAFQANPRNRGQYAPPMDSYQLECQRWLDSYNLKQKTRKAFDCPANCGFGDDDQMVVERHVRAAHPRIADELLDKFAPTEPEPDRPRRGRPPNSARAVA